MRYCCYSKLVACLLLATFLVAGAGSLFGYAWCFGDDGHVDVSFTRNVNCCNEALEKRSANRDVLPNISQRSADSCGSCLDVSTQQRGAVTFKRLKQVSTPSVAASVTSSFSHKKAHGTAWSVRLASRSLRVSPTILAQRTVVLLN